MTVSKPVKPESILKILGYKIDRKGNVNLSDNQMAVITLESTDEGGVLRIHGDPESFFYDFSEINEEFALPSRITSKFVYFSSDDEELRIDKNEFVENMLLALAEYDKVIKRKLAG